MAGRLTLSFNDGVVGEFDLDQETMVIGRRPESDIQIDNLAVSGRHARIMTIAGESFLEDLGSTNGTFVNGKQVTKHPLADGDEITIGKHALRYAAQGGAPAKSGGGASFAETIVISADETSALREAASQAQQDATEQPDAPAASTGSGVSANIGKARLKLVTDSGGGKEMQLSKALTTLGKPGVQVAAISRRQNGDFLVHVDGGENNAKRPIVNGAPIGVKSQLLADQDVIEIAGVRMQYLIG
jgi:pSer/pThr/pTyr-binding forkhead associated (FHA) protein